ncbi:hybrid sensor histidine kinase/response regulator [Azospirillum soli]|uniref:hybrid sensor histidine kinase/response regulator n=1 Tax=Azospirillum soli TaxID=1304799 RepID=UPI001AEAE30C|nr:ATP-binding protein [Azospirillum soli]MBP2314167.1 PAS domain S-box-containing protein [Azospirillum soli]
MKLDTRLSTLAAVAALPVVLFAAVLLFLYGNERRTVVEQALHAKASGAVSAVERQIANEFGVLNALATSEALDKPDLTAFRIQAQRVLDTQPTWGAIVLNQRDRQLMNTRIPHGEPLPMTIEAESLDRVLTTGRPQVSDILRMPEWSPVPFLLVRVPVIRDGAVRYALTAYMPAYPLAQLLREQVSPQDWRMGILDRNGRFVARTASPHALDPAIGALPPQRVRDGLAEASARNGIFTIPASNGRPVTGAAVHSELTGWTVMAGNDTDTVTWATHRSVILAGLGGLLAVCCATALAWGQIRAHQRQREAERIVAEVETERAVTNRLSDIAAHFPGVLYRRVLKDGVISYPYISNYRHVVADATGIAAGSVDGEAFARAIETRMTPASRQTWKDTIERSARTGEPYAADLEILAPDGCIRTLRSLAQTRRAADGSVIWDGLILDVTEALEAETRSRVNDERLRLAAEAARLGTFDLDITARKLTWSPRCKAMFGLPPDAEVNGAVYLSRVHPDDIAKVRKAEAGAFDPDGPGEYNVRFRALWPDGTVRWLEALGKVLFEGEGGEGPNRRHPARLIGTVMDVTENRRAERALKDARDRAEQANRSKSKFLAAASHDLRQPLQSVFLFTEALQPHIRDAGGREKLMHLERGLDALKGLLDSLLDVSSLDAGIVTPVIEDVPLARLFEELAVAYTPVASGKGLSFHIDADCACVRSDRTLLARMLRNIIENAIRYTAKGGIRIACKRTGDRVVIDVADTGIGIPPEHLERIWEEFHQVGNPERDRQQGTGLGLAIVRRIASLLDHPVSVRSAPGRGSVFSIDLPAGHTAAATPFIAAPARERPGTGQFAVVVDDDAIVLLGLKTMFEEWGYDVLVAGSTQDAVQKLEGMGRRPDVLVVDYRLRNGRVGTEAITAIRRMFDADIPGLILTGETAEDCRKDAAQHGLGLIHKPVTPRQLGQALQRHRTKTNAAEDAGREAVSLPPLP